MSFLKRKKEKVKGKNKLEVSRKAIVDPSTGEAAASQDFMSLKRNDVFVKKVEDKEAELEAFKQFNATSDSDDYSAVDDYTASTAILEMLKEQGSVRKELVAEEVE